MKIIAKKMNEGKYVCSVKESSFCCQPFKQNNYIFDYGKEEENPVCYVRTWWFNEKLAESPESHIRVEGSVIVLPTESPFHVILIKIDYCPFCGEKIEVEVKQ